ncbi:transposase [Paraburkholderia sp. JPY465]|uniref:transposase n=1 Tax=Paraburkholderia sp. JPY465 TaxID=3042285 RepID=UPI003D197CF1
MEQVKLDPDYALLNSVPGIGPVLATTIMLETGTISRFNDLPFGHFDAVGPRGSAFFSVSHPIGGGVHSICRYTGRNHCRPPSMPASCASSGSRNLNSTPAASPQRRGVGYMITRTENSSLALPSFRYARDRSCDCGSA